MPKVTFSDRLRYAFDNYMARGTIALIGGLALASAAVVFLAAVVVSVFQVQPGDADEPLSFVEAAWLSLLRTLDPGTMGGDVGTGFRLAMLFVTLGGIFIISALIGVLNNGIEDKLTELRKGRSRVIESGHTIILGWSEQVYSIVSELVQANANLPKSCIVILAPQDKVEMEEELRDKVGATGRTRVVCRTGNPIEIGDLAIASPHTSRAIIILSPPGPDPDSQVIKTVLALINNPDRRPEPYHIVAELHDPKNVEVAQLVGKEEAELVLVGDLISRIIAQTCRQSGLSVVYTELLDFGGDEIYLHAEPALVGRPFGECLLAYPDSTVIGLRPAGGQPKLNPHMDTLIREGDELLVIAEDDDTIRLAGPGSQAVQAAAIRYADSPPATPERSLILGWNWRAPAIVAEIDNYVAPGSEVTVVADFPEADTELARRGNNLQNLRVQCQQGDTTDRRTLDALDVARYNHVIVLSYSDLLDEQQADARTLITLLHLRDIADRVGANLSIVSEMLDLRNRALAEVTRADDFIVSDKIISLMLSQVAENKYLNAVFRDIFDPEGSEIYLKPASQYVALNEPVNFFTVVESARGQGAVAIGYRCRALAGDASRGYGVVVNPDKAETVTFTAGDRVIVIAEQ